MGAAEDFFNCKDSSSKKCHYLTENYEQSLEWEKESVSSYSCGIVKDDEDAMSVLKEVALSDWDNDIYSVTIHSVIYNQTNRTVYWVGNRHYGEDAYIYRFNFME